MSISLNSLKRTVKRLSSYGGVRGKKRDFKERMLTEAKTNAAALKPLADLEKEQRAFSEQHRKRRHRFLMWISQKYWRAKQTQF